MAHDVVALGELLIDFTGHGDSAQGNPCFEANPGGAPCNVLAMLAKLGYKTAFVGKVGGDMFGVQLKATIEAAGIGSEGLVVDANANTTLAFVHTAPDGDRSFSFFRKPGADTLLKPGELNEQLIKGSRIFHFGSLSLTDEPARGATVAAVSMAREAGALVSFDPNLRPPLWADLAEAARQIRWGIAACDILKIADEELEFLYPGLGMAAAVQALRAEYPGLRMLFVTKGKHGAECYWQSLHVALPTYTGVKTIDTTGAGDTFCGCVLHGILQKGLEGWDEATLAEMVGFANAAASLVTAKKGALRSMPAEAEVRGLMAGN